MSESLKLRLLFDGDSITDSGRDRRDPASLGDGYVRQLIDALKTRTAVSEIKARNIAVSGNRSEHLAERWDEPLALENADVVTVLVGVNDTWHSFTSGISTTADTYENNCDLLFRRIRQKTDAKLIIMEPFLLDINADITAMRPDLGGKTTVLRKLARQYAAAYIPLDGLFAAASVVRTPAHWATDGVHPTPEGHRLIASAWLDAVDELEL